MAAIRRRGGSVVVVDPRRTETAARATEWVPIRPGTDALLLFAMLRTLAEEGAIRRPATSRARSTVSTRRSRSRSPSPLSGSAGRTGIDAATIRRLADDLAAAERPVLYSRIGACTQEFGTLATWLVFVDQRRARRRRPSRRCGVRETRRVVADVHEAPGPDRQRWEFGRFHSRVRGAPEVLGQFPLGCLAEEIDTPGEGRIRALIRWRATR